MFDAQGYILINTAHLAWGMPDSMCCDMASLYTVSGEKKWSKDLVGRSSVGKYGMPGISSLE